MKPLPLSATSTPRSSFQLAVPIGLQLSRFSPANSVTQPALAFAVESVAYCASESITPPATSTAVPSVDQGFIVSPPVFNFERPHLREGCSCNYDHINSNPLDSHACLADRRDGWARSISTALCELTC